MPFHETNLTSLARLLLLALLAALFELFGLLVRLFDRLTNFTLPLARLDGNGHVACAAVLCGLAHSALGLFPVCSSGTDFISVFILSVPMSEVWLRWDEEHGIRVPV